MNSKLYSIKNDYLELTISSHGAEIISLITQPDTHQMIWPGDTRYWSDHAPILFPAVGDWRDNKYIYREREYEMPLHGFARMQEFRVTVDNNRISCLLEANEETLKYYPFYFSLEIVYQLLHHRLAVRQIVTNYTADRMPYSIGEHMGFQIPLLQNENLEDYYLQFSEKETAQRYPLIDGRIIGDPVPCLQDENCIPLTRTMFENGAWNFTGLKSQQVILASTTNEHRIIVDFPDFSHFSIWSVPGADFLCIEPCKGIAASAEEGYNPFEKKGIRILEPGRSELTEYFLTL